MIWLVTSLAYLLISLGSIPYVMGTFAWHWFIAEKRNYPSTNKHKQVPSGETWFWSAFGAFLLCWFWPIAVPICIIINSTLKGQMGFLTRMATPNQFKPQLDAIREKDYKVRIKELEESTGIR